MSIVEYEQKKHLEESRWVKKKAEGHQQEVESLGMERTKSAVEFKDRVQSEQRLECGEARIMELERRLMEMSRNEEEERMEMQRKLDGYKQKTQYLEKMLMLEVPSDYHLSDDQELHQFSIGVDSKQKRHEDRGAGGFKNSSRKSAESYQPEDQQHLEEHPSMQVISAKEAASAAGDDAESKSPTYDSEVIPDSIDAPLQPDEDPSSPIRISEVDANGSFIRLTNILSEDVNVGRFYVAQWRPGGKPSTSFQLPISVILPGLATVTIWSASSSHCLENPPTDLICERWLCGEECTTVICQPNQQAILWKNPPWRSAHKQGYDCLESTNDPREYKPASAEGEMEEERLRSTGDENIKRKEVEEKASLRKRSRSSSRNQKLKQEDAVKKEDEEEQMMKDRCSGSLADCEYDCEEEEEEEDNGYKVSSSNECDNDDDECGTDEIELVDCWWGERRCNLAKTIPGVSIHLDDLDTTTTKRKTKGQGSDEDTACRGRESNECASSRISSQADAHQGRDQEKGQGWIPSWLSWFKRGKEETKRSCENCDEKKVTRACCDEKSLFARGCCEDDLSMEGGCCENEKKATKKKLRRSRTCCEEEEEEEDCVDPCQRAGRRYDSDFVIVSSRGNCHLASGGIDKGIRSRRGGCGGGGKMESMNMDVRVPLDRTTSSQSRRCL